jgi:catechol 2,3-dioxygenase-like lactoylglutathione lyase family enzyme
MSAGPVRPAARLGKSIGMSARIAQVTLDANDVGRCVRFWSAALDYRADWDDEDRSAKLYPPDDAPPDVCTIWVQSVDEPKRDKLRLHLDLRPDDGDVDAEVDRLIGLGAERVDVGQTGDEGFVVLRDPAGNEFCVLRTEPRG